MTDPVDVVSEMRALDVVSETRALDVVSLTRALVAFDTINPPGQEEACALYLKDLLDKAGFTTELIPMGPGRANLVAHLGRTDQCLCFTGHMDTVPLGARPWSTDPHGGEIVDGRLYGRGTTDMKGGIAAFVVACLEEAERIRESGGVRLVITAGEETGGDGAVVIAESGKLGTASALVVAEPTSNVAYVGHKGAYWLKVRTSGITAHGSMPERGVNAIGKAARVVERLMAYDFGNQPHPELGAATLNVGTIHGGLNVNSVPDRAEIGVDIRTIPGLDHEDLRASLADWLGEDADIEPFVDLPALWGDPDHPWLRQAIGCACSITGHQPASGEPRTATYFTDASILTPAFGGIPTVVLGPGEPGLAHQTDEYCRVDRLNEAVEIYRALIRETEIV